MNENPNNNQTVADAKINKSREEAEKDMDKLRDFALEENEIRDGVAKNALGKERDSYKEPERKEYVNEVCARFIQEEINASGINEIEDPKKRVEAIRELTKNISVGVEKGARFSSEITTEDTGNTGKRILNEKREGVLLSTMLGQGGTISSWMGFPKRKDHSTSEEDISAYLEEAKKHAGTLNYILAESNGLGEQASKEIMKNASSVQIRFDSGPYAEIISSDIRKKLGVVEGGPIIPEDLPEEEKEKIREQFEKDKEKGKETAEKKYNREKGEILKEIERETKWLNELEQQKKISEDLESAYEKIGTSEKIAEEVAIKRRDITRSEIEITRIQKALDGLSFLRIFAKSKLKSEEEGELANNSRLRNELSIEKGKYEKVLAAEEAKKGIEYNSNYGRDIAIRKENLQKYNEKLAGLEESHNKFLAERK